MKRPGFNLHRPTSVPIGMSLRLAYLVLPALILSGCFIDNTRGSAVCATATTMAIDTGASIDLHRERPQGPVRAGPLTPRASQVELTTGPVRAPTGNSA
ncbi:MAG TPA: hypothetical protein VF469_08760 [Kofleriaceae bacterium]